MYDIIIGRNEKDRKKYGIYSSVIIGKHYVKMGQTTSLSNPVYLDVATPHVVFVCGKRGSGKCLTGDTLITLNDGSQKQIKCLAQDDHEVLSLNSNLKIETKNKLDFFEREVDRILKIKLRSGKEIKLTLEHPLLTIKGWINAEKLSEGARIATPRVTPFFGEEDWEEHKIKVMAYLIAEGHVGNNFILFSNADSKIVNDFKNSINDFDPNLQIKEHSRHTYRVVNKDVKRNCQYAVRNNKGQFVVGSKFNSKNSLRKMLEELEFYNLNSYSKYIPDLIFKLPKHKIALFLNRLFSCDGSLYKHNGTNTWIISYCSSSKKLIFQVQELLIRFGIQSRIREKKICTEDKKFFSYELETVSESLKTFLNEIGFFGIKEERQNIALRETAKIKPNPNVDTIPKEVWDIYRPKSWAEAGREIGYAYPKALRESMRYSPSRQKLLQIAKIDNNEFIKKIAESDIFWDEIISIKEETGKIKVYDISVPETHNFVANGIIVHNSYTMGVIAEGILQLPPEIKSNLAVVMLDTMGIYWTMKYPNKADEQLLKEWGLEGKPLDVCIYTPVGYYKEYKEKGIPTDFPFSIKPSELNASDWQLTFNIPPYEPIGVLIESVINDLLEEKKEFAMDDIIKAVENAEGFDQSTKNAAKNRFVSAKRWGLFSDKGTPIDSLVRNGQVTVLDVSCYAFTPGAESLRALVIGLVSQKLFISRMVARRKEEYDIVKGAIDYLSDTNGKKQEQPLVWLIIDEAHEFLPNKGKTAASNALITILREGRQPGISLVLASQQPGKIHIDVMTQSDVVISHRVTAKVDVDALGMLMQSYMREGLDKQLNYLPRVNGAAIIFDDSNERLYPIKVKPRITWHGGAAPTAIKEKKKIFDF